jgi:hypothetical protein
LSFGLSNLNTVDRRKIRSGSSAADAGEPGHSSTANATRTQRRTLVSHWLKVWNVMMISVGDAFSHVMRANFAERYLMTETLGGFLGRLTEYEAFLLRSAPKSPELRPLRW